MADWTATMQQTFEYYIVDPGTWRDSRKINTIISSSINRDLNAETLGSATIDSTESLGECYVRIYLVTIQNRIREKHPLGTFLIQTPSYNFDGKIKNISMDAYTPLLELKENPPPLGYSVMEGQNILDTVIKILRDQVRAPVIISSNDERLYTNFVSDISDTWITFVKDMLSNAKMSLGLDELGRIMFVPEQDTAALQPIWTYTDDNSSISYSDLGISHDMYGIPNVVEVIYSNGVGHYYGTAINDDPSSPISTVNRGRKITHRITDPNIPGNPSQSQIQQYAEQTLKNMSTVEFTITYKHGYCPVRLGDCVRLNFKKAGLNGVKAKVISQSIDCIPGTPVTEKAIFTSNLWEG